MFNLLRAYPEGIRMLSTNRIDARSREHPVIGIQENRRLNNFDGYLRGAAK